MHADIRKLGDEIGLRPVVLQRNQHTYFQNDIYRSGMHSSSKVAFFSASVQSHCEHDQQPIRSTDIMVDMVTDEPACTSLRECCPYA